MKIIIVLLTLAATAGIAIGGATFVFLPCGKLQVEDDPDKLEDKYPTSGGQQMRPRF